MGFPINPDGTIDYENPAPVPTRLTDKAAGYDAPSEAAMTEAAKQAYPYDSTGGDGIDTLVLLGRCLSFEDEPSNEVERIVKLYQVDFAKVLDAFARQAVAARDAEIIEMLAGEIIMFPTPESKFYNNGIYRAIATIKNE